MRAIVGRAGSVILGSGSGKYGLRVLSLVCGLVLAVAVLLLYADYARGAGTVPRGFTQGRVASGLNDPTAMAFAPDGRLFVAQQGGRLRVIKNGRLLSKPFATFNVDSSGERGLLGVAFDPNFSRNKVLYVYYTTRSKPVHNQVVRLKANGNHAVSGSRKTIFRLNNLSSATNHNGGAIHFGRDNKLYIAVGDNADLNNAQTLKNLKGKMLRINRGGGIPSDNPFYKKARGKNRAIWARGLRNPFSFDVQPGTGKIFINDVGQKTWEEINRGVKGANYGWSRYEGPENNPRFRGPIFAYRHGNTKTTGCAITGGAFYNPPAPAGRKFPAAYAGDYFFADFCSGWIRRYDSGSDRASAFATGAANPVDLKVGPDGSLYYLARGTGSVNKIQYHR